MVKYVFIAKNVQLIIIPFCDLLLIASINPITEVYINTGEPYGELITVRIAASTKKWQLTVRRKS